MLPVGTRSLSPVRLPFPSPKSFCQQAEDLQCSQHQLERWLLETGGFERGPSPALETRRTQRVGAGAGTAAGTHLTAGCCRAGPRHPLAVLRAVLARGTNSPLSPEN